ncbi:ABC transporter permease [Sutcliffiella rhizosphaerae]|uniref:D,D-dipeptide transport system permease protein DdpC n=1 Tax=Sutcliffiella rhizosphaerae TaxID=2880967 RepID=A0ABN8A9X4_9BACI|nr:ABC transporter permease subunit [Sutcliffiella rhizosphaerae]CAG9620442.1 putative D,D-dipeptide transport system permease protein DdpC [Sutcliffiella rhizosphaerae]
MWWRNKNLIIGGVFLVTLIVTAIIGPHLTYVKEGIEPNRLLFPGQGVVIKAPFEPSADFPLGSDREGRNLLSMIIMGTRDTMLIILLITSIRYLIGIILGTIASFKGKVVSNILNVWDQMFSSMPIIFVSILFLTLPMLIFAENRFWIVVFIIALVEVGRVGVSIRDQLQQVKNKPYVEAGKMVGLSPFQLSVNHYWPTILPNMLVNFCFDIGRVTLIIGQLGIFSVFITQKFVMLGMGYGELINTSYNWPTILGEARKDIYTAVWIPASAAFAITFVILTFNVLGEGLRKYFNRLGT